MRKLALVLCTSLLLVVGGCDDETPATLPESTPGGGFLIQTLLSYPDIGLFSKAYNVTVGGTWYGDLPGAEGEASSFSVNSGILGLAALPGKRAPATWDLSWHSTVGYQEYCDGESSLQNVPLDDIVNMTCLISESGLEFGFGFGFSPSPIDAWSPPSTGTISGSGLDSTYDMPQVQYYTMDGTYVAQDTATYVASDGSSITVPGGDLSTLNPGTYAGFVYNAGPSSTWNYVGTTSVQVMVPHVTIAGTDQWGDPCLPYWPYDSCGLYDYCTVSITLNGSTTYTASYGQDYDPPGSDSPEIATALANVINADSGAPVAASVVSSSDNYSATINFTDKSSGSLASLSAGSATAYGSSFTAASFSATAVGP
jgi:hypothetical protein